MTGTAKQAQQQPKQPKPQPKPKPKRQTTQTTVRLQDVLDEIQTAKPTPQQVQAAQQIGDSRSVADLIGWARNEVANSKATKRKGIDISGMQSGQGTPQGQNMQIFTAAFLASWLLVTLPLAFSGLRFAELSVIPLALLAGFVFSFAEKLDKAKRGPARKQYRHEADFRRDQPKDD